MKLKLLLKIKLRISIFLIAISTYAQYTTIPDLNFEKKLIKLNIDSGAPDGLVLKSATLSVTHLNVSSSAIKDLTGIQDFVALTSLNCSKNKLTSLDLSKNLALTSLNSSKNKLIALGLSKNLALTSLNSSKNKLTSLDLSKNLALTLLNCSKNKLTSLDLRNENNNSFNNARINFRQNKALSCILVDDPIYSKMYWKKAKNRKSKYVTDCNSGAKYTNIPDKNFEKKLIELGIDSGTPNGKVLTVSIASVTFLDVSFYDQDSSLKITNLTGIEDFIALIDLYCDDNQLTTLDVSKNLALEDLYCSHNQLTTLDVSKNLALRGLYCMGNQFTALDLRNGNNNNLNNNNISLKNNPNLSCILVDDVAYAYTHWANSKDIAARYTTDCDSDLIYTDIPDLNFEKKLIALSIDSGPIDGKVLTNNISFVTSLSIPNSAITDLTGIQDFAALTSLDCWKNQLTTLDLSKNLALTGLNCYENQLISLDLSKNLALTNLNCRENQLTTLDVSKNLALIDLNCWLNQLTTLDVSKNLTMKHLQCPYNELTSLDLSKNVALDRLHCSENQLTTLDVSENVALTSLACYGNQLTTLYLSKNLALEELYCSGNQLTTLSLFKNLSLNTLSCSFNGLTSLDISKNAALISLNCYENQLTTLDASKNVILKYLKCFSNKLVSLNLKNGNNNKFSSYINFTSNPDLTCILVDDPTYSNTYWENKKDATASYASSCNSDKFNAKATYKTIAPSNPFLYPNPVKEVLHVKINTNTLTNGTIQIHKIGGALVHTYAFNNATTSEHELNTSHLESGIYIVKIMDHQDVIFLKKIIKK